MIIATIANLVQILLLAVSLPLALLAYKGYRGTPWGGVLQPLPIMEGCFILYLAILILRIDTALAFGVAVTASIIGTLAAFLSAVRLTLLLRSDHV